MSKEMRKVSRLDRAKAVIAFHIRDGNCGLFSTRNTVGDTVTTIYEDDGISIDLCSHWSYFEVFGLTDKEFEELDKFYDAVCSVYREKKY